MQKYLPPTEPPALPATVLPTEGYVRLHQIIKPTGVIPVGRTRWYAGIAGGEFPPPKKIGNASLWEVSAIRDVIRRIADGELKAA